MLSLVVVDSHHGHEKAIGLRFRWFSLLGCVEYNIETHFEIRDDSFSPYAIACYVFQLFSLFHIV